MAQNSAAAEVVPNPLDGQELEGHEEGTRTMKPNPSTARHLRVSYDLLERLKAELAEAGINIEPTASGEVAVLEDKEGEPFCAVMSAKHYQLLLSVAAMARDPERLLALWDEVRRFQAGDVSDALPTNEADRLFPQLGS